MTEVSFYHLQRQSIEVALPKILEKVLAGGRKAVVRCPSEDRLTRLDSALWTYDPDSFLPHGTAATGQGAEQPIYLTLDADNPNGATLLVLADNAEAPDFGPYERVVYMFEGVEGEAVEKAREAYKTFKQAGHDLTYWQQSDQGRWEKKA